MRNLMRLAALLAGLCLCPAPVSAGTNLPVWKWLHTVDPMTDVVMEQAKLVSGEAALLLTCFPARPESGMFLNISHSRRDEIRSVSGGFYTLLLRLDNQPLMNSVWRSDRATIGHYWSFPQDGPPPDEPEDGKILTRELIVLMTSSEVAKFRATNADDGNPIDFSFSMKGSLAVVNKLRALCKID